MDCTFTGFFTMSRADLFGFAAVAERIFRVQHPPQSMGICSLHFTDNSYKRDLQAELLGIAPKHELKENAVPTCNLPENREMYK